MHSIILLLMSIFLTCTMVEVKSQEQNSIDLMSRSSALEFFQNKVSNNLELTLPLKHVIPDIRKIPIRAVESCYEARFNNRELHLFKESTTLFDVLYDYYLTQPTKQPTLESIENLIRSAQTIVQHVNGCDKISRNFKLGFTTLSDLSEIEYRRRLGVTIPNNINRTQIKSTGDPECYPPLSYTPPRQFDFRTHGAVTSVKNQGSCGSCWTFATAAAIESAYLVRRKRNLNLAEQQLVDCAYWMNMGGCNGGTSFQAYNYVLNNGITSEDNDPYRANVFTCRYNFPPTANIRKFCVRGLNYYGSPSINEELTDNAIVTALGYFGPLGVYMNADNLQNYRSGIINDTSCSTQINHAVLLVGYTENSWIVKNSWGADWGENGFFELARGSNMCGINFEISFPLL